MTAQQMRLFGILRLHTRERPIKRGVVLADYNAGLTDDDRVSDRTLRLIKESLIREARIPVGSSERGYFICESPADVETACQSLHEKAMALLSEEKILRESRLAFVGEQGRLL